MDILVSHVSPVTLIQVSPVLKIWWQNQHIYYRNGANHKWSFRNWAMIIPTLCLVVHCDLSEPTSPSSAHNLKLDTVLFSLTVLTQLPHTKWKYT